MIERAFIGPDRRFWLVRPRPTTRRDEGESVVVLEFMTDDETRVVSCTREEWEVPAPDFAGLLARSVVGGASRGVLRMDDAPSLDED
ncbi:MAG TPA: hypothetical protein VMN37_07290 [Gemmatimonadales bacterium]|nr:hypothetical protein [Gemmatimonadales bacterium]